MDEDGFDIAAVVRRLRNAFPVEQMLPALIALMLAQLRRVGPAAPLNP